MKRKTKRNNFLKLIGLILSIIIGLTFLWDFSGIGKQPVVKQAVNIPMGSNIFKISEILKEQGIINNSLFFAVYSFSTGSRYQAGPHVFEKYGYNAIKQELEKITYNDKVVKVVIPEGYELREIAKAVESAGLVTEKGFLETAQKEEFDYWFIKEIPERDNRLEGYLFPATYEFARGESAKSIITKMLDVTNNVLNQDRINKAKEKNLTIDQVITLSSIVEREAVDPKELNVIAGVFYNRLNKVGESQGYLQSCATVQYVLKERKAILTEEETRIKSPYNTYIHTGLPIGPIASPGLAAIDAVLSPKKTNYLYFVADGSGKHIFATTYAQHLQNIEKVSEKN